MKKTDKQIDLDQPMTITEFAGWLGVHSSWVRARLRTLPGVIRHSRKMVRIYPRQYLERTVKAGKLN